MGLSLLVPLFLVGLLALAVPVWVHLRDRPHSQSIDFPSLMFLERVPHRAERRQVLRNRALLALRALALSLLALAFARPFLAGDDVPALLPAGSRDVVVVLDHSASMGFADRWARAQAAAADVLGGLASDDRAALVLFDDEATVAVPLAPGGGDVLAALQGIRPGDGGTRLAAGLRAAGELASAFRDGGEAVLISDFQRRGWDPGTEVTLPRGVQVRAVSVVATDEDDNRAVTEVQPLVDPAVAGRLVVQARLTRSGGTGQATLTATLTLEGARSQSRAVELPPDGAVTVQFEPVDGLADAVAGTVSIDADRLPADDALHFVTSPGQVIRVLVLEHPAAAEGGGFFLERALGVGTRPAFSLRRQALGDVTAADLVDVDVVVANDAGEVDAGTAAALGSWVEAGGGLLLAVGELTERIEPAGVGSPLLDLAPGAPEDRSVDLGGTIAFVDVTHPALEVFGASAATELAGARFWTYRTLLPPPPSGVLARFDDGNAALVEQPRGGGRVLIWTGTFDNYWSDFPTQPAFVPFVHELVKYVAGFREPVPWLPAGRPLTARQLFAGSDPTVDRLRVDGQEADLPVRLAAGFHDIALDPTRVTRVAANVDRSEGDLRAVDPEEVAAAVVERRLVDEVPTDDGVAPEQARERRQSLWWYVMLLGFALLATETVLSNRLSSRAS